MGLIRAALNSAGGVMADQWKEFFYCEAMGDDVLMTKGKKRTSGRSSNRKGSDNIISNGSVIAVTDGQCMLIVEQGKVVEVSAEPGEYVFDTSAEPSIFTGDLGEGLTSMFQNMGQRLSFGGEAPRDQRVYYINTREIKGNKYGTPSAVQFHVSDQKSNIEIDMPIRCFGEYSYRITNPLLFYTNVSTSGDNSDQCLREDLESQMRSELLTHLGPAFAKLSARGISYAALQGYTLDIRDALREELSQEWGGIRGIEIVQFGISSLKGDEKVEAEIREMQRENRYVRDPSLLATNLSRSHAEAEKIAAGNTAASPAMAFMNMNMAGQSGTMNTAASLYEKGMQMHAQQQAQQQAAPEGWTCSCGQTGNTGKFCSACGKPKAPPAESWTCPQCGAVVTGKFCPECGTKKPAAAVGWTCPKCGKINKGKFCSECGTKKPAGEPQYKCDKCGWEPEDPAHPPKFCPECGDPFDNGDLQ